MVKNLTKEEEIECGKRLVEERILKDRKRRTYMRKYYQQRKKDGFVKCAKEKKNIPSFIIERGHFIITFD
tara:strand:+ start:207 stop:416 length:210 start_codon:yes stop_codon:yes gene_type:complete